MGNACGSEALHTPEKVGIEYFSDLHGRPEPLRAMLFHAGSEWTTDNVNFVSWKTYRIPFRKTGEMGQLPIIHYKGKQMQ